MLKKVKEITEEIEIIIFLKQDMKKEYDDLRGKFNLKNFNNYQFFKKSVNELNNQPDTTERKSNELEDVPGKSTQRHYKI